MFVWFYDSNNDRDNAHIEPVWKRMGEKYKNHNDVIIAKIDILKNEVKD